MSIKLSKDLALYLEQRGLGVYTTANPDLRTIFTGELPQDVVEGLFIIPAPSPPPHEYVDTEYAVIDFWYRSPNSDRAQVAMEHIYELFHRSYNILTPNWNIFFARALGTIADVDRDLEGGKLLRLSVQFICRNLNHIS